MVRNIIFYFLLFDLILASSIFLIWVSAGIQPHTIKIGASLLPFFNQISIAADKLTLKIPNIPQIPTIKWINDDWIPLFDTLNVLIYIINGIIPILNFVIWLINSLMQLVTFFGVIMYRLEDLSYALSNL